MRAYFTPSPCQTSYKSANVKFKSENKHILNKVSHSTFNKLYCHDIFALASHVARVLTDSSVHTSLTRHCAFRTRRHSGTWVFDNRVVCVGNFRRISRKSQHGFLSRLKAIEQCHDGNEVFTMA